MEIEHGHHEAQSPWERWKQARTGHEGASMTQALLPGKARAMARNGLLAAVGVITMSALFFVGYGSAFGHPVPHNIHIAAVGTPALAKQLDSSSALKVDRVSNSAEARRLVEDRKVWGAFIVSADNHHSTLIVANGASHSVEAALTGLGQGIAAENKLSLSTEDIAPTTANNPNGTIEFYCIIFLSLGGALGATVLGRVLGSPKSLKSAAARVATIVVYTAALSAMGTIVADAGYGALVGHTGPLFLTLWAFTTAVCLACSGVSAMVGTVGATALTLTLTILGNTSAGGAIGRPLMSGFYSSLTPFFPHGAALSITRGVQYFGGRGIADGVICLAVWGGVGLVLMTVAAMRAGRGETQPNPEPAGNAFREPVLAGDRA